MRYFKILCILAFGILLASCHKISSGTITDKTYRGTKNDIDANFIWQDNNISSNGN